MTTTAMASLAIIFVDIVLIIIIHNVNKLGRDVLEMHKHCIEAIKGTQDYLEELAKSHNTLVQAFNDMVDKHNNLAAKTNRLNNHLNSLTEQIKTTEQNGK